MIKSSLFLKVWGISRAALLMGVSVTVLCGWMDWGKGQTPSPQATPTQRILSQDEKTQLLREFRSAQWSEIQALKHRQGLELQELISSQQPRRNEFIRTETSKKDAFFKSNQDAMLRRRYLDDWEKRKREFEENFLVEQKRIQEDHLKRTDALMKIQAEKLKKFESALQSGQQPPSELWPN